VVIVNTHDIAFIWLFLFERQYVAHGVAPFCAMQYLCTSG
jgi:hypothetical protein